MIMVEEKSEEIIKYGRVTIVRRCRKIGLNWKEL